MGERLLFLVDQLGERWEELETAQAELEEEIIRCVREHGSRPAKHPGMRLAQGAEFRLALISAVRLIVKDQAAAARLWRKLPRSIANRVLRRKVEFVGVRDGEKALMRNRRAFTLAKRYTAIVKVKRLKPRVRVQRIAKSKKAAA